MEFIMVEVLNWKKYNPRADRANYSWFRFQNDFFQSQSNFGLTDSQVVLLLMIFCEVSRKGVERVEMNLEFMATLRKTTKKKILKDIQELVTRGVLMTAESRQDDGGKPASFPATNERTDKQTNETDGEDSASDPALHPLAALWNSFCGELPKVKEVSEKRLIKIRERLKECRDMAQWQEAIERLAESNFANGKNDRGWKASFDFLLQPDSRIKALEGKYSNSTRTTGLYTDSEFSWDQEAGYVLEAMKKFGPDEGGEAKAWLGEERWAVLMRAGGMSRIRRMPDDDFTRKRITAHLKNAWEALQREDQGPNDAA